MPQPLTAANEQLSRSCSTAQPQHTLQHERFQQQQPVASHGTVQSPPLLGDQLLAPTQAFFPDDMIDVDDPAAAAGVAQPLEDFAGQQHPAKPAECQQLCVPAAGSIQQQAALCHQQQQQQQLEHRTASQQRQTQSQSPAQKVTQQQLVLCLDTQVQPPTQHNMQHMQQQQIHQQQHQHLVVTITAETTALQMSPRLQITAAVAADPSSPNAVDAAPPHPSAAAAVSAVVIPDSAPDRTPTPVSTHAASPAQQMAEVAVTAEDANCRTATPAAAAAAEDPDGAAELQDAANPAAVAVSTRSGSAAAVAGNTIPCPALGGQQHDGSIARLQQPSQQQCGSELQRQITTHQVSPAQDAKLPAAAAAAEIEGLAAAPPQEQQDQPASEQEQQQQQQLFIPDSEATAPDVPGQQCLGGSGSRSDSYTSPEGKNTQVYILDGFNNAGCVWILCWVR